MVQLSEQIAQTLDMNDSATLRESLGNLQKRVETVERCAKQRQDDLEQCATAWLQYQVVHLLIDFNHQYHM